MIEGANFGIHLGHHCWICHVSKSLSHNVPECFTRFCKIPLEVFPNIKQVFDQCFPCPTGWQIFINVFGHLAAMTQVQRNFQNLPALQAAGTGIHSSAHQKVLQWMVICLDESALEWDFHDFHGMWNNIGKGFQWFCASISRSRAISSSSSPSPAYSSSLGSSASASPPPQAPDGAPPSECLDFVFATSAMDSCDSVKLCELGWIGEKLSQFVNLVCLGMSCQLVIHFVNLREF